MYYIEKEYALLVFAFDSGFDEMLWFGDLLLLWNGLKAKILHLFSTLWWRWLTLFLAGLNGPRQHAGLLPESMIWAYVVQLSSALRAIHAAGLAFRTMDPSKILIYSKSRSNWIKQNIYYHNKERRFRQSSLQIDLILYRVNSYVKTI